MKKIITALSLTLLTTMSFAHAENVDLLVNCRASKPNEDFRSFELRLRDTSEGIKMVKDGVRFAPATAPKFTNLMLNPQINLTDTELTVLAGNSESEADLSIGRDPNGMLWIGRVRVSELKATSSFKARVVCEMSQVYSNNQPVIP